MHMVTLPNGDVVPALGQGTWMMAEQASQRSAEIAALQHGIDLGMTLLDTAEMYGEGLVEELVGEALQGRRDEVYLVSKVYPWNASRQGTVEACERSLKRLRTDRLDLFLLHWRGEHPLADTVAAMEQLQQAGKIRAWGVSNLDTDDMEELLAVPGGVGCQTNQVLYNLSRRGIEFDLLPWSRARQIPIMAYSPIEQGQLNTQGVLSTLATQHGVTPMQIALAWVLHQPDVIAIPKAGRVAHVALNHAALSIRLSPQDLAALDREFLPPTAKRPLESI
ncbi:aldo/keto reductase [Salinispirillum marinum]|uniref:Aldo/keto reductase n=2 Tax=Saccharospirillaceae TaxID=255527 RepID=A0ABV8BC18_9GAMM